MANINALKKEAKLLLKKNSNKKFIPNVKYFFKEKVNPLGIRMPKVRLLVKEFHKKHPDLTYKEAVILCEELLKDDLFEQSIFAFFLISRFQKDYSKQTLNVFEKWIKKYITNWAYCDSLCPNPIGYLITEFPSLKSKIFSWHKSKNRWLRRCSLVSYVNIARNNDYSNQVVKTVSRMLKEEDDLVQKAMGWTLREAAKANKPPVLKFLRKNKLKLPRTTLRYAIERFTVKEKKELMKK